MNEWALIIQTFQLFELTQGPKSSYNGGTTVGAYWCSEFPVPLCTSYFRFVIIGLENLELTALLEY